VFFGGRAGGGKSDCLLVGAARFVDRPRYRAIIFRRTWPELQRSLFERAWDYYPSLGARPVDGGRSWEWPSGAIVELGTMERVVDKFKYSSAEFQYIGFDEAMTFERDQYTFLWSRLRSSDPTIPLLMRAGTNPGGVGADWIADRFAPWIYRPADGLHPEDYEGPYADPGERLHVIVDPETGVDHFVPRGTPGSYARTFFPASLDDNPSVNKADYLRSLQNLDPVTRRQLELGDWLARGGARSYFRREWFEIVHDGPHPTDVVATVRYWDRAATEEDGTNDPDWTAGVLMAKTRDGTVWVLDVVRFRAGPGQVEQRIEETAIVDGDDVDGWLEHDPGQAGKAEMRHLVNRFARFGYRSKDWGSASKLSRARPYSAAVYNGTLVGQRVKVLRRPWTTAYLLEAEAFAGDDKTKDDQIDASSGAFWALTNAASSGRSRAGGRARKAVSMHGAGGGF
jgi:predicted phage terminase large subunit-like protein